jgi:hypothetical protein
MVTKKQQAIELFYKSPKKALAFCKKWNDLGKNRDDIVRGAECITNARFYAQLGFNTEDCISLAITHLRSHLGIQ